MKKTIRNGSFPSLRRSLSSESVKQQKSRQIRLPFLDITNRPNTGYFYNATEKYRDCPDILFMIRIFHDMNKSARTFLSSQKSLDSLVKSHPEVNFSPDTGERITILLDLDETLIHSEVMRTCKEEIAINFQAGGERSNTVFVRIRPGLSTFL